MVRWTRRRRARLLLAAQAALLIALAGAIAWALHPAPLPEARSSVATRDPGDSTLGADALGRLADYEPLWRRKWREPLWPPEPVVEAPKPDPKFPGTLSGTAVETGFSYAIFHLRSGDELVDVGEAIGQTGWVLVGVTNDSATVRLGEFTTTINAGGAP